MSLKNSANNIYKLLLLWELFVVADLALNYFDRGGKELATPDKDVPPPLP